MAHISKYLETIDLVHVQTRKAFIDASQAIDCEGVILDSRLPDIGAACRQIADVAQGDYGEMGATLHFSKDGRVLNDGTAYASLLKYHDLMDFTFDFAQLFYAATGVRQVSVGFCFNQASGLVSGSLYEPCMGMALAGGQIKVNVSGDGEDESLKHLQSLLVTKGGFHYESDPRRQNILLVAQPTEM